jgi:hypothetical protein
MALAGISCPDGYYVRGFDPDGQLVCDSLDLTFNFHPAGTREGHSYHLSRFPLNWTEAKHRCEILGGHLATLADLPEDDLGNGLKESRGTAIWMGLTDQAVENKWLWVTGEPVAYLNWAEGQPDNAGADPGSDCALWTTAAPTGWDDAPCGETHPFICEFEP